MSWYFLGGFSAYAMEPSARWVNQSGCSTAQGWSGEVCSARSSATSMPSSRVRATNASKSANVPSSGWIASWPPSGDPIAQPRRHGGEGRPVADRPRRRPRRAVEQEGALRQHQLHVLPPRDLDARVVAPMADGVAPGLHVEPPPALGVRRDLGRVPVQAGEYLAHPGQRLALAVRATQHHSGPGNLMSLTEHGRADLEGFPGDGLGRSAPAVDHGLHVTDHYPTDHPRTLPSETRAHSCRPRSPSPYRVALRESHP